MNDILQPVSGRDNKQGAKRLRDLGDATHAEVVALPGILPTDVAANTPVDARAFGDVEFQFTAGAVNVTRSLNGANYLPWPVTNSSGSSSASAATPGIYSTDGGGWLKFSAPVTMRAGA